MRTDILATTAAFRTSLTRLGTRMRVGTKRRSCLPFQLAPAQMHLPYRPQPRRLRRLRPARLQPTTFRRRHQATQRESFRLPEQSNVTSASSSLRLFAFSLPSDEWLSSCAFKLWSLPNGGTRRLLLASPNFAHAPSRSLKFPLRILAYASSHLGISASSHHVPFPFCVTFRTLAFS